MFLAGKGMVPTHNSTLAAGVGLYLLIADDEMGPEVYSAATDIEQARIVHGEAVRMVRASYALQTELTIHETTKNILFRRRQGFYRAVSSESENKEGLNASGIIIDELHAWRGRKLWDVLRYSGRARKQPLIFVITTAGDDPHGLCGQQHDYALGVLKGTIADERYFAYVRCAEPDDDLEDPTVWAKANPALGSILSPDDFKADLEEAKRMPTQMSAMKRYTFNLWITSSNPWLSEWQWRQCGRDFTAADLEGQDCYGGLDLAKVKDMTAFVLCFPRPEGEFWFLPWFWLPEETALSPDANDNYRVWAEQGLLNLTPGNVCDYGFVKRDIDAISKRFNIVDFAFDPYNAEKTTQEIEEEIGLKRFEFRQTIANYAEPTAEFERLVVSGLLGHNRNPILSWQAGHVQVKSDPAGNKRPIKPRDQNDARKVDGVIGAVMALARAMAAQNEPCVYEERGVLVFGGADDEDR
jgi:phage terminase large subunit-like protein